MTERTQPLILVVDDYQDAREMYAEYLQFSGFRVAEARNGNEAVTQAFELHPPEGPVGTPIELRVKGLGWRTMDSTWVINWDNQEVGWVSATDTRGSAVARFRASGGVGDHHVRVYTGYMGQGYLNHEQAPNAYLPRPGFVFRVTAGRAPQAAYAEPYQKQPLPAASTRGRSPGSSTAATVADRAVAI